MNINRKFFQLSYLRQTFVTQTIRLTNCLWNAIEAIKFSDPHAHSTTDGPNATTGKARSSGNTRVPRTNDVGANPFSVVVVMKVLEECLVTVPMSSEKCRKVSGTKVVDRLDCINVSTIHFVSVPAQ